MLRTIPILLLIGFCINVSGQRSCVPEGNQVNRKYFKKHHATDKFSEEQKSTIACPDLKFIPVAVHFNDPVTCENSDCLVEVVEAQIAVLNEHFMALNPDLSDYENLHSVCPDAYPLSTMPVAEEGTCVQFCLASKNHPAGSGLNDGDPAITVGQYIIDVTNAPEWEGYLNIFVDGSSFGPTFNSSIPGLANGDGFWVNPANFGGPDFSCSSGITFNTSAPYKLGRQALHAAGHYFGLSHPFGSCTEDADSDPPGPIDVEDTPRQQNPTLGCPIVNDCGEVPLSCTDQPTSFYSYMDYTDDACIVMFTADQSEVINWHANDLPFVENATVCAPNYGTAACNPDFTPIVTVLPSNVNGITTNVWTFKIQEVAGFDAVDAIFVYWPMDPRLSFTYDNSATDILGLPVSNSEWSYDTDGGFHVWKNGDGISANASSTFGISATYDPQSTSGIAPFTVTLLISGGEVNGLNNSDSETLIYFSN